jgi:hypothetical protein
MDGSGETPKAASKIYSLFMKSFTLRCRRWVLDCLVAIALPVIMSKRKLGSHSPTGLTPKKKKTRVVPTATLHQWTAQDFKHMVYTPPASLLPSPFAINYQLDRHIKKNIAQFGPALQTIFEPTRTAAQTGARKSIKELCDDDNIVWIDPMQPIVLKAGEGLSLYIYLLVYHT